MSNYLDTVYSDTTLTDAKRHIKSETNFHFYSTDCLHQDRTPIVLKEINMKKSLKSKRIHEININRLKKIKAIFFRLRKENKDELQK